MKRRVFLKWFLIAGFVLSAVGAFGEDIFLEMPDDAILQNIVSVPDGGFFLCGRLYNVPWISWNNSDGKAGESRSFVEFDWGEFRGAAFAGDGSLLAWGVTVYTEDNESWSQDVLIVRFDPDGVPTWTQVYSPGLSSEPLMAVPDGQDWVVFSTSSIDEGFIPRNLNLFRFDEHGRTRFKTTFSSERWSTIPQAGSYGAGQASFAILLKPPEIPALNEDEETEAEPDPDEIRPLDPYDDPYDYKPPDMGYHDIVRTRAYDLAFLTLDVDGNTLVYDEYTADIDGVYDFAAVDGSWVAVVARHYQRYFQHTGGIDMESSSETDFVILEQGSGDGETSAGVTAAPGLLAGPDGTRTWLYLESASAGTVQAEEFHLLEGTRTVYRYLNPQVFIPEWNLLILENDSPNRFVRFGKGWIGY